MNTFTSEPDSASDFTVLDVKNDVESGNKNTDPTDQTVKHLTLIKNHCKSEYSSRPNENVNIHKKCEQINSVKRELHSAIGTLDSLLKCETLTRRREIFETLQMMEVLTSKLPSQSSKEDKLPRTPSVAVDVSKYFKED